MSDTALDLILASWDRHSRILANLVGRVSDKNALVQSSGDGSTIAGHLAHIHETRYWWLGQVAPELREPLGEVFRQDGERWIPIDDLNEIKRQLALSSDAVLTAVRSKIEAGASKVGPYSHAIFFLQHMLWHEGYHFGLVVVALRNAGEEPSEEWEEANVWGIWRS